MSSLNSLTPIKPSNWRFYVYPFLLIKVPWVELRSTSIIYRSLPKQMHAWFRLIVGFSRWKSTVFKLPNKQQFLFLFRVIFQTFLPSLYTINSTIANIFELCSRLRLFYIQFFVSAPLLNYSLIFINSLPRIFLPFPSYTPQYYQLNPPLFIKFISFLSLVPISLSKIYLFRLNLSLISFSITFYFLSAQSLGFLMFIAIFLNYSVSTTFAIFYLVYASSVLAAWNAVETDGKTIPQQQTQAGKSFDRKLKYPSNPETI